MPKVFDCMSCLTQHARPVGKNVKAGESFSSDSKVVAHSSYNEITGTDEILKQLRQLCEKMDCMDKRVQHMEATLKKSNSQATNIPATSLGTAGQVMGYDSDENIAQSVVSSLDFLRNNESLQTQVERRLAELKNANEMATRGRLKSKRCGPGDVTVKKLIDWPQNLVLTGAHKTRPTYDDLTIIQWVSGFFRCILEEKSASNRHLMLDYLGNLMEDASDFSWDSAKVAHCILLTNMDYILCLFGILRRFQRCTGHITTGSWKGRGNQYIQFVRVLYCKLLTNGKQLPAFPLEAVLGIEPQPQRGEARVLPLCHRGPSYQYGGR